MTKQHPLTPLMIQNITEEVASLDWDDRDDKEDYILARRFYDLGWKRAKLQDEAYIREAFKQGIEASRKQIDAFYESRYGE